MSNLQNMFPDGVQPTAGGEIKPNLGDNPSGKTPGDNLGSPNGKLPENLSDLLGS